MHVKGSSCLYPEKKTMIRRAQLQDLEQCLDLYNYYIRNTLYTLETEELTPALFIERFRQVTAVYPWLVAEENGEILGYAYLDVFNPRKAYSRACDLSLYVRSDQRGRGTGTLLLQAIEEEARRAGMVCMISIVTGVNEPSIRFHEKAGFVRVADIPRCAYKHGEWTGVYYYQKMLSPSE